MPVAKSPTSYTSLCVPHLGAETPAAVSAIGGNPDLPAVNLPGGVWAISCTGHNSGQCIGLSRGAAGARGDARVDVGSSPTVTGFDDNAG